MLEFIMLVIGLGVWIGFEILFHKGKMLYIRGALECPQRKCKHYGQKCSLCARRVCLDMFEPVEGVIDEA